MPTALPARAFHLDRCLGRGGFGEVYQARMVRGGFEVEVAVKLLRTEVDPRSQAAARLRDEARLLGLLRHPAVPRVYDLTVLDGRLALITELIEGADLDAAASCDPPLPRRAALDALATLCDALHAAWTRPVRDGQPLGLIHRDLKPSNLRLGRDGLPRLLDLGIAYTATVARVADTQTGALVGSPAYMAPERFDDRAPGPEGDVWSMGCVLYELLAQRRLFADLSFHTLAGLSLTEERLDRALRPRLAHLPTDTPPALRDLLRECLAFEPRHRPTAADLAQRFTALAAATPGDPLSVWARTTRWPAPTAIDAPLTGRTLTEGTLLAQASTDGLPHTDTESGWGHSDDGTALPTLPEVGTGPTTLPRAWHADAETGETDPHPAARPLTPTTLPRAVASQADTTEGAPPPPPRRPQPPASLRPAPDAQPSPPEVRAPSSNARRLLPVAALALVGLLAWSLRPADLPDETLVAEAPAPPVATPPTDIEPVPAPPPPAAPEGEPPVARNTARAVAPDVRPAPSAKVAAPVVTPPAVSPPAPAASVAATAPPPSTTPPPAAPAAPTAVPVRVSPDSTAYLPTLHQGGRRWELPADVPPGTYEIRAEFVPGSPTVAGKADVADGRGQLIRCTAARICRALP